MAWSMLGRVNQKATRAAILIILMVTSPAMASSPPYYASEDFSPHWEQSRGHQLRFSGLVNQHNQATDYKDWQGKVTVVNFFFTGCPGLCELLMKRMSQLRQQLPKNVRLVSISVDPGSDTPVILSVYAKKYSNNGNDWLLYTGTAKTIETMARDFFFAKNTSVDAEALLHNESFYLLDQSLNLRGIYNGTLPRSIKEITDDVSSLRK